MFSLDAARCCALDSVPMTPHPPRNQLQKSSVPNSERTQIYLTCSRKLPVSHFAPKCLHALQPAIARVGSKNHGKRGRISAPASWARLKGFLRRQARKQVRRKTVFTRLFRSQKRRPPFRRNVVALNPFSNRPRPGPHVSSQGFA